MTLCSMEARGPWGAGSCTSGTPLPPPPPPPWPSPLPSPTRRSGASSSEPWQGRAALPLWSVGLLLKDTEPPGSTAGLSPKTLGDVLCSQHLERRVPARQSLDLSRTIHGRVSKPRQSLSGGIIHMDFPIPLLPCLLRGV